ncbi:MAG: TatD family hydrolase [Balneolaceae bacterium]|nr:TatD family hydrolase [Balneolaceae bacterium]
MLVDTHCHIYLEHFEEDIDQVLDRAVEAGVGQIYMPAINFDSLPKMDKLSHDGITFYKMAGIHPTEINDGITTNEEELFNHCNKNEIVAVGETGLDYYWSDEYKSKQQESLRIHCNVAKSIEKPIILHNRESTKDMLNIIEEEQDGSLTGIWHCFNGSVEEGKRAIDLGLHLGIGGVLTFKNGGVDKTVAELPLEKMMLETDAPYLAPSPNRGKRNEPAFVRLTAKRLAEVLNISFKEMEAVTTQNALQLFGTDA